MKVRILISMNEVVFNDEQRNMVSQHTAEWVVVRTTAGKILVHAIINQEEVPVVQGIISFWEPAIIGCWLDDGNLVEGYTFNQLEYGIFLSPEEKLEADGITLKNPLPMVHLFGGWLEFPLPPETPS